MALTPLATQADMEARGVTVALSEELALATFLDTASATVREAAGCPISETTDTVVLEGGRDLRLPLPGPPVSTVSAVLVDGVAVSDWTLRSGALLRDAGWQSGCTPPEVTVTYTHGLPTVPADIVDLVCRLAAKSLVGLRTSPEDAGLAAPPLVSERIGDYSAVYSYNTPLHTEAELPDYLRGRLRARFGGGAGVVRLR
ncbi:hypothetical protein ACFPA8_07980 [Streptomyces ovatisporus]|uniref:Uncharacterized protein n=1 Tax=Streptomyces ovatisporus TaxID=1128682 RepID=A0ABV9A534_9ACTN